ncbi:MAG TPA: ABC transporter permease, partial [Edaphobacter sp.]
ARRRMYRDLEDEIQQHLAEKTDALMAEGMSRKSAEHAAKREFGNVTTTKERSREAWMWPVVESVFTDLRLALRKLRRSPGFTATAVLTLALGIGANVVVFSVLNGLVLRPLEVPEPNNLFQVINGQWYVQSYRDYLDYRNRDGSFSGMMAYQNERVGVTVGKSVSRSWGFAASGNYFEVLGLEPALGRFFHPEDEHGPGSAPYLVLSYDFWQRQFSGSRDVLGQTVELNKHPFTVIGVAGKDFHGTDAFMWPDYWFPLMNAAQVTGNNDLPFRDHYGFSVMGRLKKGVTPQQATQSLNALTSQMGKEDKKDDGLTARLIHAGPGGDANDPVRKALLGMMMLATLVLLAACVNLASIFAARAADRSSELAVRMAIGSSRWHVVRQLLAEAVLVSGTGGMVGVMAARALLGVLSHWQPFGDFPTHFLIAPNARVYLVALGLSIGSGILFGLLPARQVLKMDVLQAIKTGGGQSESFRGFALRDVLLLVQIAVCTLLVTASLVAARGMQRALRVPLGFEPRGVVLAQADLRMAGYSGETAVPVQKRFLEVAAAIPGVNVAAGADAVPFQGGGGWFVYRDGTTEFINKNRLFGAPTFLVSPGYLEATKTRLMAGREFNWHDDASSPGVAMVNEAFAKRVFGNEPAIGRHFLLWATARYEVVGVLEDGKYGTLVEDATPAMFFPMMQGVGGHLPTRAMLIVRSELPADQMTTSLRRALANVEPNVPFSTTLWEDEVDRSMVPARAATTVLSVMGLLAAMLAVTGVFGMASYAVAKRMKEQGIRIALGAQHLQVMRSTLGRPVLLLLVGAGIGLSLGVLMSRVMAHLVAYATSREPLILAGALLTMLLLGVAAMLIPARRTLAIDPAQLLRE